VAGCVGGARRAVGSEPNRHNAQLRGSVARVGPASWS
jgi:hypothetical protein